MANGRATRDGSNLPWWFKPVVVTTAVGVSVSMFGLIVAYPALSEDVDENSARIDALEKSQRVIVANQRAIDEGVRNVTADTALILEKTDEVLMMVGSTKQFKRPPVPKSELEDPDDIQ